MPTWRTMMPPALICSPPYTFTPRNCALEPRPLRDEPPPFLCAMRQTLSSGGDRSDLHFGEILAMPHLALEALAAAELEHDQLLATTVPYDFCLDLSALDERLADIGT